MSTTRRFFRCNARLAALLVFMPLLTMAQGPRFVTDDPSELVAKPDFDIASQLAIRPRVQIPVALVKPGSRVQMEERLGVPTFIWAVQTATSGRTPEAAARQHLSRYASVYRQGASEIAAAELRSIHDIGRGPIIVKFGQSAGGVEIFREEVAVTMNRQLDLIALSGYTLGARGPLGSFAQSPVMAVARAIGDLLDITVDPTQFRRVLVQGAYERFDFVTPLSPAAVPFELLESPRAKKVFFRLGDRLEAAYYVEVQVTQSSQRQMLTYSYVIGAGDGRILLRHNQTHDANQASVFSYRVWASPNGLKEPLNSPHGSLNSVAQLGSRPPLFTLPELITLQNGPISSNDPWLPAGATETSGNNVEAYADLDRPDGFRASSADLHARTNGPNLFDRTYNTSIAPQSGPDQIQAAVTQIFYTTNFLHDWFYDSGFKEIDGNAQASNYGRGGLENDSLKAEAQDYSSRNNGQMSTPADGSRPRMQIFIFDGVPETTLTATAGVQGSFNNGYAWFGPDTFEVLDTPVSRTTPRHACTPLAENLAGRIAFIDRGVCGVEIKVRTAQAAGAAGVIIANVASSPAPELPPFMAPGGLTPGIRVGALSLGYSDGELFRKALADGLAVRATLRRTSPVKRDGALDNQLVAHEWGHFISNRLVHDAAGLTNPMSWALGEGWADFHALLLTARQEDTANPSNAAFNGAYPTVTYAFGDYYFGVRRVPYSTDFAVDPLTFRHISDGVPLPPGVPYRFGADGARNAEVHNAGEVWATMLWECYTALLRDTLGAAPRLTFDQARGRMKDYLVAAYKMTPPAPTLLEARDALLAAAMATDNRDLLLFWQAFARRGAGINAIAPDRHSITNSPGLVESYEVGGAVSIAGAALSDSELSCDQDGSLDNGETGRLTVSIRNSGLTALTATTATITTSNPFVKFPNGNTISFQPTAPFATAGGFVNVSMQGAPGVEQLDFVVTVNDPALMPAVPVTTSLTTRGNQDTRTAAAANDDVEAAATAWNSTAATGSIFWSRTANSVAPLNFVWHGPTSGLLGDRSIVTPVLAVGPNPFSFSFRHRFSFESDGKDFYDGGVIEISADGGATWSDIGVGYEHTIFWRYRNPLAGRPAYTGDSPGYPAFSAQTIDLGTRFANRNVIIRFRVGEDLAVAAPGWDIDNFEFTGISNTPFTTLAPDPGC